MKEVSNKRRQKYTKEKYFLLVLYKNNWNPLMAQVINSHQTLFWHIQHLKTIPTTCITAKVMWQLASKDKTVGVYNFNDTSHRWIMMHLNILWQNWKSFHLRQDSQHLLRQAVTTLIFGYHVKNTSLCCNFKYQSIIYRWRLPKERMDFL